MPLPSAPPEDDGIGAPTKRHHCAAESSPHLHPSANLQPNPNPNPNQVGPRRATTPRSTRSTLATMAQRRRGPSSSSLCHRRCRQVLTPSPSRLVILSPPHPVTHPPSHLYLHLPPTSLLYLSPSRSPYRSSLPIPPSSAAAVPLASPEPHVHPSPGPLTAGHPRASDMRLNPHPKLNPGSLSRLPPEGFRHTGGHMTMEDS